MIDRDLLETLIALALILACATTAIATTRPPREERVARRKRKERHRTAGTALEASEPPPATVALADPPMVAAPAGGRPRPRILTGEPAAPEPHRPATRRAVALVVGITALAAGGAVGLLAFVRMLVEVFERIGD